MTTETLPTLEDRLHHFLDWLFTEKRVLLVEHTSRAAYLPEEYRFLVQEYVNE